MKKIICVLVAVLLIVGLFVISGFGSSNTEVTVENPEFYSIAAQKLKGTTLNVFNWGEYISDGSEGALDVIGAFEKLTGITVNYSTFDSNESMYGKMESESVSYDIIIPSDYMIDRMRQEGRLKEIDFSKIPNYQYIYEQYKNSYYDPENQYTVPYSVGMVGLIYNKKIVKETPDSWGIMWDEKYNDQILTFNNPRDAFAIAQFYLGIDINTENKADWDKAAEKLREQNKVLQGRVMDEVFNKMESGNAAIAPYYAGDYLTMADVNPDLGFVYPKEGTNIFVDALCIPSLCQNYEAALLFINFLLEPEVALANAEYICYASPNSAVVNHPDYSLSGNEYLYPENQSEIKTEYFHNLDKDLITYFEKLWQNIRIN
jgi:spermidine/putrescine transport system substrate-binding protein